jgi:hypothetical protein
VTVGSFTDISRELAASSILRLVPFWTAVKLKAARTSETRWLQMEAASCRCRNSLLEIGVKTALRKLRNVHGITAGASVAVTQHSSPLC